MNSVSSPSSLSSQERHSLEQKISSLQMKDRASFGLVAKYKCFEPYSKARICAQQVYQRNEMLRRKVLEIQNSNDQTEFMNQNYNYILKKCEAQILLIGECVLKGQLELNQ